MIVKTKQSLRQLEFHNVQGRISPQPSEKLAGRYETFIYGIGSIVSKFFALAEYLLQLLESESQYSMKNQEKVMEKDSCDRNLNNGGRKHFVFYEYVNKWCRIRGNEIED